MFSDICGTFVEVEASNSSSEWIANLGLGTRGRWGSGNFVALWIFVHITCAGNLIVRPVPARIAGFVCWENLFAFHVISIVPKHGGTHCQICVFAKLKPLHGHRISSFLSSEPSMRQTRSYEHWRPDEHLNFTDRSRTRTQCLIKSNFCH